MYKGFPGMAYVGRQQICRGPAEFVLGCRWFKKPPQNPAPFRPPATSPSHANPVTDLRAARCRRHTGAARAAVDNLTKSLALEWAASVSFAVIDVAGLQCRTDSIATRAYACVVGCSCEFNCPRHYFLRASCRELHGCVLPMRLFARCDVGKYLAGWAAMHNPPLLRLMLFC